MKSDRLKLLGFALAGSMVLGAGLWAGQPQSSTGVPTGAVTRIAAPADDKDAKPDPALVAKGKQRFEAYRCFDCHGHNGEGTEDAPDLIGTHLDADGIAKFLEKPSADAQTKGMPTIDADSPDLKPLVAFVLSIKKSN